MSRMSNTLDNHSEIFSEGIDLVSQALCLFTKIDNNHCDAIKKILHAALIIGVDLYGENKK